MKQSSQSAYTKEDLQGFSDLDDTGGNDHLDDDDDDYCVPTKRPNKTEQVKG